jgi:hypothetical protein
MRTKIKFQHHPTTPKEKKAWTPWMHSRLVSLATNNFYALFVLFTINGRGIIWRDLVFKWFRCSVVVPTIGAGSLRMVSAFIIRSGSFDAAQELLSAYTFFCNSTRSGSSDAAQGLLSHDDIVFVKGLGQ